MSYSPGFPINTGPAPDGDSVKAAVEKHISEFLKAYADITAMYQQILVEIQHADVDTVDGKHADGTANNIPLLNNDRKLTYDLENSSVKTEALEVTGSAKIKTLEINGVNVDDVVSSRIKIETGLIGHGDTIPLPAGFTQAQCKWFVSLRQLNSGKYTDESVWADENRVVTCRDATNGAGVANYLIIGIK